MIIDAQHTPLNRKKGLHQYNSELNKSRDESIHSYMNENGDDAQSVGVTRRGI